MNNKLRIMGQHDAKAVKKAVLELRARCRVMQGRLPRTPPVTVNTAIVTGETK